MILTNKLKLPIVELSIIVITLGIYIIGISLASPKHLKVQFKEIVVTYKIHLLEPHKVKFYLIWNYKRSFKKNWNPHMMKNNSSKNKEGKKITKFVTSGEVLDKHWKRREIQVIQTIQENV